VKAGSAHIGSRREREEKAIEREKVKAGSAYYKPPNFCMLLTKGV
jgi:hypothetical protein